MYIYDSGSRRPSSYISYEAPFSSLAFRDDGWMLAAGTSNGRVAFYDVRGKPQPVAVLHAYGSSSIAATKSVVCQSIQMFIWIIVGGLPGTYSFRSRIHNG